MNTPLITIIIPCYNVEQYLPKCIDSILTQSYTNLEIILVDDGSPDNCGAICDNYAKRDSRIRVIHKTNGGLSDARNTAIDTSRGDYITFIDSDDFIAPDYVECLYNLIKRYNAQIAITTFYWFYEKDTPILSNIKKGKQPKVLTRDEALTEMFYQKSFDTAACGKLYLRSLFENVRYPKGLLYEDLATTYRLINKCSKVAFVDYKSYFYLLRNNSIEGSPFKPLKYHSLETIVHQLEKDKSKMGENVQKALSSRIISLAFHVLLDVPKNELSIRHSIFKIIKKYRSIVIYDKQSRKKARIACLLSYFGLFFIDILAKKGKSRIS